MSNLHEEEALGKAYDSRLMRRLLQYMKPYKWRVALALIMVAIVTPLELAPPLIFRKAIDSYFVPRLNGTIAESSAWAAPRQRTQTACIFDTSSATASKRRHRAERTAHVVLVQTGRDDADARVSELHAHVDHSLVEELHFVDAHDLHADLDPGQELLARSDGEGLQPPVVARHDVLAREAVVDHRLEDLHTLPGDDRASQPADQLLRFSGEHPTRDDLDPAASVTVQSSCLPGVVC